MIERESILPLGLGALLALMIHLAALPGAMLWWQKQSMLEMQATTHSSAVNTPAFNANRPPTKTVVNQPKPTITPPKPNTPHTAQTVTTKPPPVPSQPMEPSPPQVQLGRDDAEQVYRVGWISYDDFQQLIAPRSTTEQPALQSRMTPQKEAPLRGDPTLPTQQTSTVVPTPSRPVESLAVKSAVPTPTPPTTPPPQPSKPLMASAVGDNQNAVTQTNPPQPEKPLIASVVDDNQNSVNQTKSAVVEITPDVLTLASQNLAELGGSITNTLALATTDTKPSNDSTAAQPSRTPSNNNPPTTRSQAQPPPQAELESNASSPSNSTSSPSSTATISPTQPLVPDLRMIVVRPGSTTPQAPATSRSNTATKVSGSDDAFRPSSAPRSDRESPPVSLTDHPVNVRLQPGAVLVGRGVEIKTALPRLSTVARFIPPKNARVRLTFDRTGQVLHALFLQSTESESWDGPILASLYQWRATGKLFDEHPGPFILEINLIFVRE